MLSYFRNKGASIVVKLLMGMLVLSFAVWGIGDIFSPNSSGQSIADAGDTEVTQQEFLFNLRRQNAQLRANGFSEEMLAGINLSEVVVNQLVTRAVYEEEARKMNVVATDQIVGRTIRETESFQDSAGNFDRNRYEFTLNNQGYNSAYFERLVSKEVVANMLLDSISAGIKVSKSQAATLYKYQKETRDVSFVKIAIDDAETIPAPTSDELNDYYEINKERFRAPDYRKLSYVSIDPDFIADSIKIDDARLKEIFEQRVEQYSVPEKRTILQMLLPDQETATKAREAIVGGKSFADVAMEFANQDADAINLGTMTKAETPDEKLADAAFSVNLNDVSQPVESLFGWYLLSVTQIEEGTVIPFETVSANLNKEIAREEAVAQAYDLSNQLDDTLAGGATLEEAGSQLGLTLTSIEAIDRNGLDLAANPINNIPNPASFLKFAFDTEEGLDSLMQDDGADGFFILRVDGITETRIKSLDEVREEAIALWDSEQRRNKAKTKADALVTTLNGGAKLANDQVLTVLKAAEVDRQGKASNDASLPGAMITSIFEVNEGKATTSYADNAYVVAQVDQIITPMSNADSKETEDNIKQVALGGMSSDIIEQYNMALRERHSVTINRGLMNTLANSQVN